MKSKRRSIFDRFIRRIALSGRLCSQAAALSLVVAILALAGCNTNGCLENRNSVPLAGFYSMATLKPISVDSVQITGEGMPEDDPLLAVGTYASQVYMPMRSTRPTTTWVFAYKQKALDRPELNDTLTFDYESTPFFAGSECGVVYYYDIKRMDYTRHLIDSVAITDSLVTNLDIERIQIYFRTSEPEQ